MSFNVAMLEALKAEGLDLDACIRVLKAGEKKADPTNAERQARYRAKRKDRKDARNARYSNAVTPPNDNTLTPESSEPEGSSLTAWACPAGVDPGHWADLRKNRKTKRLTDSETAYQGLLRDLETFSDDEWPPGRLVQHAAERGWGAIYDPRKSKHGPEQRHSNVGKSAAAYQSFQFAPGETF